MAGTYDLMIEQGADFNRVFTWRDDAGALINLTGYTARMKIKTTLDGTDIAAFTHAAGITLGGAAGTVTLNIAAAVTAAYIFSTGVYDLELISGGGGVTRFLQGGVILSREVTTT